MHIFITSIQYVLVALQYEDAPSCSIFNKISFLYFHSVDAVRPPLHVIVLVMSNFTFDKRCVNSCLF